MVEVTQRERDVAHRQTRAEEEHVLARGRPRARPATRDPARSGGSDRSRRRSRRIGRREVPDREHDPIGDEQATVGEGQRDSLRALGDPDDLTRDPEQREVGRAARLVEPRREVLRRRTGEGRTSRR